MANSKSKVPHARAQIHELAKEIVERDPKLPIIKNGVDNLYPQRIERIVNNSPTAKSGTKLFRKYTVGKGIPKINKQIVDPEKNTKGLAFLRLFAESCSIHKGAFIHVMWTPEVKDDNTIGFYISSWKVIPYPYCRVGKKDDNGWHGKIVVYEKWDEDKIAEEKIQLVDVFNPKPEVIKAQIANCKGETDEERAKNYKGQILFVNPENRVYPLAHIDEAYDHADSEYRASLYVNTLMRHGFVGATFFFTPPLEGDQTGLTDADLENMTDAEKAEVRQIRSEAEDVRDLIKNTKGVDKAGATVHIEMQPGDNFERMEDAILVKQFKHEIDDKTFKATEESSAKAIQKALNQIPGILLNQNDSSIFGNSGELLKEAKKTYQENCDEDRGVIEETIETLIEYTPKFAGVRAEIEKLVDDREQITKVEDGTN